MGVHQGPVYVKFNCQSPKATLIESKNKNIVLEVSLCFFLYGNRNEILLTTQFRLVTVLKHALAKNDDTMELSFNAAQVGKIKIFLFLVVILS